MLLLTHAAFGGGSGGGFGSSFSMIARTGRSEGAIG
jgi:hypothetical protein